MRVRARFGWVATIIIITIFIIIGEYVGEMALLNDDPRTATVTATKDVECFKLSRADFVKSLGNLKVRSDVMLTWCIWIGLLNH